MAPGRRAARGGDAPQHQGSRQVTTILRLSLGHSSDADMRGKPSDLVRLNPLYDSSGGAACSQAPCTDMSSVRVTVLCICHAPTEERAHIEVTHSAPPVDPSADTGRMGRAPGNPPVSGTRAQCSAVGCMMQVSSVHPGGDEPKVKREDSPSLPVPDPVIPVASARLPVTDFSIPIASARLPVTATPEPSGSYATHQSSLDSDASGKVKESCLS